MNSPSAMQNIDCWPIQRLVEHPRNPRKNDSAVDRMCGSIREFGFKIPCLVRSDGEVVDGHPRLKAARKLGIAEVPVILCYECSEAQVKAWRSKHQTSSRQTLADISAATGPSAAVRAMYLWTGLSVSEVLSN
jgi:hypothetical protein